MFPARVAGLGGVSVAEFDVFFCLVNTAEGQPRLMTRVRDVLSSPWAPYRERLLSAGVRSLWLGWWEYWGFPPHPAGNGTSTFRCGNYFLIL